MSDRKVLPIPSETLCRLDDPIMHPRLCQVLYIYIYIFFRCIHMIICIFMHSSTCPKIGDPDILPQ